MENSLCCNPGFGCPRCICRPCFLIEIQCKKRDRHNSKFFCKDCFKKVKFMCKDHVYITLLELRDIKHEKLIDDVYRNEKFAYLENLFSKMNNHPSTL